MDNNLSKVSSFETYAILSLVQSTSTGYHKAHISTYIFNTSSDINVTFMFKTRKDAAPHFMVDYISTGNSCCCGGLILVLPS